MKYGFLLPCVAALGILASCFSEDTKYYQGDREENKDETDAEYVADECRNNEDCSEKSDAMECVAGECVVPCQSIHDCDPAYWYWYTCDQGRCRLCEGAMPEVYDGCDGTRVVKMSIMSTGVCSVKFLEKRVDCTPGLCGFGQNGFELPVCLASPSMKCCGVFGKPGPQSQILCEDCAPKCCIYRPDSQWPYGKPTCEKCESLE